MRRTTGREIRALRRTACVLLAVFWTGGLIALGGWGWYCLQLRTAYEPPAVERCPIEQILEQETRSAEDDEILTEQTGLSSFAVEDMLSAGRKNAILRLQEVRFSSDEIRTDIIAFPVWEERLETLRVPLAEVQDGDILITSSARLLGWRMGHCGLVVDADAGLTLEALGYGGVSTIEQLSDWESRPDFVILRPNLDEEIRRAVAKNARENLTGVPYGVSSDFFGADRRGPLFNAHCAYIVWYAYFSMGYDLDGNGGWVVTPRDFAKGEGVTVVQSFGIDPDLLWHELSWTLPDYTGAGKG